MKLCVPFVVQSKIRKQRQKVERRRLLVIDLLEERLVLTALNPFQLSSLSGGDGSVGVLLNRIDEADVSGESVSVVGDINGDGFDDLIIRANVADPNDTSEAGESYVVFGRADGFSASLDLSLLEGSNDFVLNGIDAADDSGYSTSSAGDFNGDGIDDLVIGGRFADANGTNSGESYVVFGQTNGFPASLELSLLDGSNGFVLYGVGENDLSGQSVSSAGDLNGDGFDDVIVGANAGDPNGTQSGESYVVSDIPVRFPLVSSFPRWTE